MKSKEFKTLDEQIELLKQKGLIFKNEEEAKNILARENYYFLTQEYEDVFMNLKASSKQNMKYASETYFEELYAIYNLDRELRNLIFDYISLIETHLESYTSYVFAEKYGYKNYLKRENFIKGKQHDINIANLFREIEQNKKRNFTDDTSDVKRYYMQNKFIPPWVIVKIFTFGTIANFYALMKDEDKKSVAEYFGVNANNLNQYLKMLIVIRNICAHGDILFNIRLRRKININDNKYHEALKIQNSGNSYEYGANDLFAVMIILKNLLIPKDFKEMFIKIENILSKVKNELDSKSFNNLLEHMGLPTNYNELDTIN